MKKQLFTYLLIALALVAQAQKPAAEDVNAKVKSEDKNPNFKRELSLEAKTENKGEITINKCRCRTITVFEDASSMKCGRRLSPFT